MTALTALVFVLVQGATNGGCWRAVRQLLTARGSSVFTPTLTGMGECSHLLSEDVGIPTHVEDISNLLFYEDLRDIILVGHSYAGVVVEQVGNDHPERIKALVQLHAFGPEDDQCLWDLEPPATQEFYEHAASAWGDGWRLMPERAFVERWGIMGAEAKWTFERLTPFPLRSQFGKVSLDNSRARGLPRTYIEQTGEPMRNVLKPFEAKARQNGWRVVTLDSQHDSMITVPAEVTNLLIAAGA